jgi:hypothetical protein
VGTADSKKEKSASAHASTFDSAGAAIGAGGVDGRTVSCLAGEAIVQGVSFACVSIAGTPGTEVCQAENSSNASSFGRSSGTVTGTKSCSAFVACFSSVFFGLLTDRFADFRILGPIGPCSMVSGTKLFALNSADVGDIVLFRRTMGDANIASGEWSRIVMDLID